MKKDILHVVESFGGGVYDFIVSLVNGLPEFNHTILYAKRENFKENFQEDFSKDISFIYWKNASREINLKKDFLAGKELYKILSKKNYHKIHLHSSKAGFIGRVVGRMKQQHNKILYTTHGVSFLRQDVSKTKNNLYILLEKIGMFLGGEIIACSKSEADFMKRKGIIQTQYIFNGIKKIENIPKIEKNNEIINIVTVGRITYQKNPNLFNEIAREFIENKKIKFTWIGDGELKNELNSPNIEITGWKSQEEVLKELSKGDIYLSTSLWEGLPLSVLQGMAIGLPLLLSNCVGNTDLVENGKNGFIFENKEEVIKRIELFLNENLKLENIDLDFSIESMYKYYQKFYCIEEIRW